MRPHLGPVLRRSLAALAATTALAVGVSLASAVPAAAANRATPGDFTGFGFDQCTAPTQAAMDAWLQSSPYLAVGIYISGASRGCRSQPNLTPTWVSTQLARGWRLLPITLGPQASCSTRFPRYGNDPVIDDAPGSDGRYAGATAMGTLEGSRSVEAARNLGISAGSTLWYDLEGFNNTLTRCRQSAIWFLSAWVARVKALGYRTGVYSSGASGIKILDDAKARGSRFSYPDYLWVARWDGVATVETPYVTAGQWWPHRRVKQYRGGHDERYGGVTINIDNNYLDVGRGTVAPATVRHCGGTRLNWKRYGKLYAGHAGTKRVKTLQCLLKERGFYRGDLDGRWNAATQGAAASWQRNSGSSAGVWGGDNWSSLLTFGGTPVLKQGSSSDWVRRVQRALNATRTGERRTVTGVFDAATTARVRAYQSSHGLPASGVVNTVTWASLQQ